jgi:tetratricopeptide (TPR) repeat protein
LAVPLLAWFWQPATMRQGVTRCCDLTGRGLRSLRLLALGAMSLFGYVELRKRCFPTAPEAVDKWVQHEPLADLVLGFLSWFAPPPLPDDPLNNPLLTASSQLQLPTACGLFLEQLTQLIVPWPLSGDYSYPSELPRAWDVTAALGAVMFLGLLGCSLWFLGRTVAAFRVPVLSRGERGPPPRGHLLLGGGGMLFVLSYLPISNALVLLPTIRAERLLYLPAAAFMLGVTGAAVTVWDRFLREPSHDHRPNYVPLVAKLVLGAHLVLIASSGRAHAFRYASDLQFWSKAASSSNPSAKSLLNLGIMLGARGDLKARERLTKRALALAGEWDMALVYMGDVLCRKRELEKARAYYMKGLKLARNNKSLTALALQCIWERGGYLAYHDDLTRLADEAPDTWLAYFLYELANHGEENQGIPARYRPLGYNRAPRIGSSADVLVP